MANPRRRGGCAPLAELYSFQMIPNRRRSGHATLVTGINRLDTRHTCGFRYFTGLTYGTRSPVRIGYPTIRQFLHAKGPLAFTVNDVVPITLVDGTHRYEEKLTRHVVMTFTRRPFTSDPPVR